MEQVRQNCVFSPYFRIACSGEVANAPRGSAGASHSQNHERPFRVGRTSSTGRIRAIQTLADCKPANSFIGVFGFTGLTMW